MEREDGKAKFLDYQRSRLRIARATVVNLICLIPCTTLFIISRTDLSIKGWGSVEFVVLAFLFLSMFAAVRIDDAYLSRLVDAYNMLPPDPKTAATAQPTGPVSRHHDQR